MPERSEPKECRTLPYSADEERLIEEMAGLRKAENITQKELAFLTGSSQQVISRIEHKKNSPSLGSFCLLLNALGYELQIVPWRKVSVQAG